MDYKGSQLNHTKDLLLQSRTFKGSHHQPHCNCSKINYNGKCYSYVVSNDVF
jgi:hypothetical protein